jgi:hypothetical protein
MKLKTLENVLSELIHERSKLGVPISTKSIELFVWTDTIECKPIVGRIFIAFNGTLPEIKIFEIVRLIDRLSPITMIRFNKKEFHVTKTEEFMKKPCSCSDMECC